MCAWWPPAASGPRRAAPTGCPRCRTHRDGSRPPWPRSCRRRSLARRPRRTRRPAEGRRSRVQRCRWSCFLLDGGSCDFLTPCLVLAEAGVQPCHQLRNLLALGSAELPEELGRLGVAILGRLEFEHPVTRPQLEVERQRPQQVLKGLVNALGIPQLAEAVAHSKVTSSVGHREQRRG